MGVHTHLFCGSVFTIQRTALRHYYSSKFGRPLSRFPNEASYVKLALVGCCLHRILDCSGSVLALKSTGGVDSNDCGRRGSTPLANRFSLMHIQRYVQSLQHHDQPRRYPRMDPRFAGHHGNLEPSLDVYPNMPGPIVRNATDGRRELAKLLWGMPTPIERVKGKADYGTTNIAIRNMRIATIRWCRAPCRAGDELRGA